MADDPLDQYGHLPADGGSVRDSSNPIIGFVQRMNRGELPLQQTLRSWFDAHPTQREVAARLMFEAPVTLGPARGAPLAGRPSAVPAIRPVFPRAEPTSGQRALYEQDPRGEMDFILGNGPHRDHQTALQLARGFARYEPQSRPPSNAPQSGPTQAQRDYNALDPTQSVEATFGRRAFDQQQNGRYQRALREMNPVRDPMFAGYLGDLPEPPPRSQMHADGGKAGSDPRDEGRAGDRQGALDDWERRNMSWSNPSARQLGAAALRTAKGFGAGLVSPFWWLAKPVPGSRADRLKGALDDWQDEAPIASMAGAMTLPTHAVGHTISEGAHAAQLAPTVIAPGAPLLSNIYDAIRGRHRSEEQLARDYGAAGMADGGAPSGGANDALERYVGELPYAGGWRTKVLPEPLPGEYRDLSPYVTTGAVAREKTRPFTASQGWVDLPALSDLNVPVDKRKR